MGKTRIIVSGRKRWGLFVALIVFASSARCKGTSIVFVVSNTGEYVALAADSRNFDSIAHRTNDEACKVIVLGADTLFYESSTATVGDQRGLVIWSSQATAREVYRASTDRSGSVLARAWGRRTEEWFANHKWALTGAAVVANGAFIRFDRSRKPTVFSESLLYDSQSHGLSLRQPITAPDASGEIGKAGDHQELVAEFVDAQTPRALKAYGTLGIHQAGTSLAYDTQFVRMAVQFVIDNVSGSGRQMVHGPIDVVVLRPVGGVDWEMRKRSCFGSDLGPTNNHPRLHRAAPARPE